MRPATSRSGWGVALLALALLGCGPGEVGSAGAEPPAALRALAAGGRTVFASGGQTCGLLADGGVQCWGAGGSGQLGDGTLAVRRPLPVAVAGLPGPADAIAVGGSHACAVVHGAVWCWGDDTRGQVAPGPPLLRLAPARVPGLPGPAVALAAGIEQTCAVADGAVWCWGANEAGESGAAIERDCRRGRRVRPCSTPPVRVTGASPPAAGARALALGARHGCALAADGVRCWGANDRGQRGDPGAAPRAAAAPVEGLAHADALAAGRAHTCARAGGAVTCWGGAAGWRLRTVSLPGAARRLAAGGDRSCAAVADAVWCWEPGGEPERTLAFEADVTHLAVGWDHVCAAADGDLRCRGDNDYGQLGSGDAPRDHDAPVRVRPWDRGGLRDRDGDGRIRVVCLGDSNTESPTSPDVPPSWCDRLGAHLDDARVRIVNRGWGGATALETASLLPARVPLRYALENDAPDAVLLAFGTNDVVAGEAPEAVAAALDALALRAVEAGAEVFVALLPPVQPPGGEANARVARVNALLRERWPAERVLDFHTGFGPSQFEDALHLGAGGQERRAVLAADALRRALGRP